MSRVLVIIPAFNEEESLAHVVAAVRTSLPQADIAVVNDGSRDRTAAVVEKLQVVAFHLPHHVGVGAAEQTGFRFAARQGYDIVVRNDGDGQHRPAEIPLLLSAVSDENVDVVIGSRYLEDRGYVTPRLRRLGIHLLAGVVSLACRQRFTDPTSGFRAFSRRAILFCAQDYPSAYPEPESVVQFVRAGLKVREIPVTMNPRYGGRSSIRVAESVYYMVRVLMGILVELLRGRPPIPPEGGGQGGHP
jgi:hypothetical protein